MTGRKQRRLKKIPIRWLILRFYHIQLFVIWAIFIRNDMISRNLKSENV